MNTLFVRNSSSFMMILLSLWVVISKTSQFSLSIYYLLWGIPIILINLLDIFFLGKSLLKKPKNVDTRISSLLISLGGASSLLFTSFFVSYPPLNIPYAIYLKALAAILNLITYPLVIWSLLCLRSCLTVIPEAHKIVANGPYKYSRHPLYVCFMMWAVANVLIFQSIPFIVLSVIYIYLLFLRLKREEELLLATFPEYKEYYENTGLIGLKNKENFKENCNAAEENIA